MLFLLSPVCFCSFSLSNSRGARPGLHRVRGDTPFHGEPLTGLEQHSENMGLDQMGDSLETVCRLFMIKDSTGRVTIQSRARPAHPASFFPTEKLESPRRNKWGRTAQLPSVIPALGKQGELEVKASLTCTVSSAPIRKEKKGGRKKGKEGGREGG